MIQLNTISIPLNEVSYTKLKDHAYWGASVRVGDFLDDEVGWLVEDQVWGRVYDQALKPRIHIIEHMINRTWAGSFSHD